MSFPTDGYSVANVQYTFTANNGVSFNLTMNTQDGVVADYETLATYVESGLDDIVSAYATGEGHSPQLSVSYAAVQASSL